MSAASSFSPGVVVVNVLFALSFGTLAFLESRRFRRTYGTKPWGVPSVVWGLLGLLLSFFALFFLFMAELMTRRRLQMTEVVPAPKPSAGPPPGAPAVPMAGAPAGPAAPPGAEPRDLPLFGWYADPSGRHHTRYWDGRGWTTRVSDGGPPYDDPTV